MSVADGLAHAGFAVAGAVDREAFADQIVTQQFDEFLVVIHQQNPRHFLFSLRCGRQSLPAVLPAASSDCGEVAVRKPD